MSRATEIKKLQVELHKVQGGRMDMELRIEERLEEIQRLKDHMVIQQAKEEELAKAIVDLKAQP